VWKKVLPDSKDTEFLNYFLIPDIPRINPKGGEEIYGVFEHLVSYKRYNAGTQRKYDYFGDRYRQGFDFAEKMIKNVGDIRLEQLWNKYMIKPLLELAMKKCNEQDLRDYLSQLSNYATKTTVYGVFGQYYRFFKNLLYLGPNMDEITYKNVKSLPRTSQISQVRKWVTGKSSMEKSEFYSEFLFKFRKGVKEWLKLTNPGNANEYKYPSVEEYIKDPAIWGTSGGTSIKMHSKFFKNTKSSNILKNYLEIKEIMLSTKPEKITVAPKNETKLRVIASGDMSVYLKMNYLYMWLQNACSGHPNASMFWGSTQLASFYEKLGDSLQTNFVGIATDLDAFDWNVSQKND
jgi:hypothetical protein